MTKLKLEIPSTRSALIWILLAVAVLVVYFFGLSIPLLGPDEPRYAQVAREMFERGDWVTPTLGGFEWFEKPALLYWVQIASYHVFGVSEFSARFGSAVFGLATVGSLWLLGRHIDIAIYNGHRTSDNSFANWFALIAATTVSVIAFAHGASFDIILAFPVTAALVSYFIYESMTSIPGEGGSALVPLMAFYVFMGIAVLGKGLVGIVLPLAIIGSYFVLRWRWPNRQFIFSLVWGLLISIGVASLWYLPMYLRHGWEFIDEFFVQHHFARYTSNKYFHPQPFYFYVWILPLMTIPWTPFLVVSLVSFGRRVVAGFRDREPVTVSDSNILDRVRLFSIAWLVVPIAFFSFSGSKLPGYILPVIPAAVILTGEYVVRFVRTGATRRYFVQAIAAGTLAVMIVTATVFFPAFAETDSVKALFAAADARGLGNAPVLMLHDVSHNAEFYAAGRIVREEDGRQKRLLGPPEVLREIRSLGGGPVLVLVPLPYLNQLTQSEHLGTEVLKDNGEHVIARVQAR